MSLINVFVVKLIFVWMNNTFVTKNYYYEKILNFKNCYLFFQLNILKLRHKFTHKYIY